MYYFILLTFLAFVLITPFLYKADVILSVTKSILVGILYDRVYIEDEQLFDNTLQFCFVFVLITFKWDTK